MDIEDFISEAKKIVSDYTNMRLEQVDDTLFVNPEDVFIVWMSKTLQNSKLLLSTPIDDGMYYEVTLDGDKKAIYFDAYKKEVNERFDIY